MKWIGLAACLALAGCLDNVGPRPRPGGPLTDQPSDTAFMKWYETVPRVVTQGTTDSVRIDVTISGVPDFVTVQLRNGGVASLNRVGTSNVYSRKFSATGLLFGYHVGDLHITSGFIEVTLGGNSDEHNLIMNVKDGTVPTITARAVVPGIQAADNVVNIRYDSVFAGRFVPAAVLRTYYSNYPDDAQFIAVIEQVESDRDHFFTAVRNHISGIGMSQFDDGAAFGSDSALAGIIQYPFDTFFDLSETSNIHDIAHRWMNYLRHPLLAPASPHWPLSDLASGLMGWSDPVTRASLIFPYALLPQPGGTFTLQFNDRPRTFNDLELYLMGLAPADSVQPHIVFRDQNQASRVRNGGALRGPVDSVTIAGIIAVDGPRVPAAAAAPRQFHISTIVLSKGGLLTRDELSFFDHMAARGAELLAVQYSNGLTSGTTLPFYGATGGRGLLITKVKPALK